MPYGKLSLVPYVHSGRIVNQIEAPRAARWLQRNAGLIRSVPRPTRLIGHKFLVYKNSYSYTTLEGDLLLFIMHASKKKILVLSMPASNQNFGTNSKEQQAIQLKYFVRIYNQIQTINSFNVCPKHLRELTL